MKNNNNLKIAILGYGSMGKEVEKIANVKNIEITDIFDINNRISPTEKYDFDIAIDFTFPDAVLDNVKILSGMNKNIIIGTTGWDKYFSEVKQLIEQNNIGLVYASNFSLGMQMFMRIVDFASKQIATLTDYDIFMNEIHHRRKKDAPSGTALVLANNIIKNVPSKKDILTNQSEGEISNEKLFVSSTRGGEITGIHSIYIDSLADTIELNHRAKNRSGFATGAVEAAIWLGNKRGIYDFADIINEILGI